MTSLLRTWTLNYVVLQLIGTLKQHCVTLTAVRVQTIIITLFKRNYVVLFACIGYRRFDLFVFDEKGCELSYQWTTTLELQPRDAPIGWDPETAFVDANASIVWTACPPSHSRAQCHPLRSIFMLSYSDLKRMEMPYQSKQIGKARGYEECTLVSKGRSWTVKCVAGFFIGDGWRSFVYAHMLKLSASLKRCFSLHQQRSSVKVKSKLRHQQSEMKIQRLQWKKMHLLPLES